MVAGVIGLSLLDAVLVGSASRGGGPVGSAATLATGALRRLIDPTVPLIPDLRTTASMPYGTAAGQGLKAAAGAASAASTTSTTPPATTPTAPPVGGTPPKLINV